MAERNAKDGPRTRRLWPGILSGVLASIAGFAILDARDEKARLLAFEGRATEIQAEIERGFSTPLELLYTTRSFIETGSELTRESFSRFAGPGVRRNPTLTAVEWIPLVPGAEARAFEQRVRSEQGPPDFFVWEPGPTGERTPVSPRDAYFPVLFAEPPPGASVGLDVGFEASRRAAIATAIARGTGAASGRMRLAEDPVGVHSVFIVLPTFRAGVPLGTEAERRAAARGLCAGLFRLEPVVRASLRSIDLGGLGVMLRDGSGAESEALLFQNRDFSSADAVFSSERNMAFHDRTWTIRVWAPSSSLARSAAPMAILAASLLSTLIVAAIFALRGAAARAGEARRDAEYLGQYRLIRKIASGGMGTVYEAEHAMLRRTTAVKVITSEDPALTARFEREVRTMSALRHPNTTAVYDFGRSKAGRFYCAMEYIDGIDLERVVTETGAMPEGRVIQLLSQVCASLAEAHEKGFIHRDVKPANVMITRIGRTYDFVKVLDFGLAKNLHNTTETKLTLVGQPVGTAQYMPPEAITEPERVTAALDVYSVGALGFFLLTGEDAFAGGSHAEIFARHIGAAPEPPSTRSPLPIQAAVDALILRCLEKHPAARFPSAIELRAALMKLQVTPWSDKEARAWWDEIGIPLQTSLVAARPRTDSVNALTPDLAERARPEKG